MSEHEFYAEPTVFDHWQSAIGRWWYAHFSGLNPYSWVIGFAVMGSIFLATAMVVLVMALGSGADSAPLLWNQSIAQTVIVLISLAAAKLLYRQALDAWPPQMLLAPGRRPARQSLTKPTVVVAKQRRQKPSVQDPQLTQEFFASVRAAGVNVAIAKALFSAGLRSPRQLVKARDSQLLAIRGVGRATVHKLRAQFQSL